MSDAKNNAVAHMSNIRKMVDALRLAYLEEEGDYDHALENILETPLDIRVRSGWGGVGEEMVAEEFEILLTYGGPSCRIHGELQDGTPRRAWIEYQDWGTGWTDLINNEGDGATLLAFCEYFFDC